MPSVVVALVVFVPCLGAGIGVTYLSGISLGFEERVAVGVPLGALLVGLWGWGVSVAIGFDLRSLALALFAAIACSLPGWVRGAPSLRDDLRDVRRRVRLPWRDGESLRPLLGLLALAWPLTVRILSLAWVTTPEGDLEAGHLATWSDGAAHLAYAGITAVGATVPPASPIAAGEPARYHLLADVFSAQVSLLGVSLPSALAVTSGFLALAFPAIAYLCGVRLTASRGAALLGVVIFGAGGGLGFFNFVGDLQDHGWSTLVHLPRTYARDPDAGLWMDNPTLAYLYAQRNGLLGLPLGLAALTLVMEARRQRSARALLGAGVLVGLLPLANGFAYLIVTGLVGCWALFDRRLPWWRFFVPVVVLGAPVALWLQPPESSVRMLVGWMADGGITGWLWFWLRNAGPFIVGLVAAYAWRGTVRRDLLWAFAPVWLLWLVPNLMAFHPWEWNNTKYFAFWQLLGAFLVGAVVLRLAKSGWAGRIVASVAMVALCASGTLDLYRATDSVASPIPWTTAEGLRVADWVRGEVPPEAVLAVAPTNTQPVTSLSGHAVVSGYPGWTFDLAVPDWEARAEDEVTILRGGPAALSQVRRYGVDYVVIGPPERSPEFGADDDWWASNAETVYSSGGWSVYRVPDS